VLNHARWDDRWLSVDGEEGHSVQAGTVDEELVGQERLVFPFSRYLVTDTTGALTARTMRITAAPAIAGLTEAGATARVLVFGNGIEGNRDKASRRA
jgi:hypothetical protein